tara:strand:- start:1485 stop:1892 length:408 start_codon:yes stop_codon:yes gene_type:complete
MNNTAIIKELLDSLSTAKVTESTAKKARLDIEAILLAALKDQHDIKTVGTTSIDTGLYSIKVTGREAHKIDSTILEEIAVENNLEKNLSVFFRWKPELNKRAWDAADEKERLPFTQAITTTIGKPSINITENIEV